MFLADFHRLICLDTLLCRFFMFLNGNRKKQDIQCHGITSDFWTEKGRRKNRPPAAVLGIKRPQDNESSCGRDYLHHSLKAKYCLKENLLRTGRIHF